VPLTPNGQNHVRRLYRRSFFLRTIPIELRFADRPTRVVCGVWRNNDTANPAYGPAEPATEIKTAQAADAFFEVLTEDISIGELNAVTAVSPASYEGVELFGLAGTYAIVEIQPKGSAWPPDRAYVLLRKV
jgi:hypothetical protein